MGIPLTRINQKPRNLKDGTRDFALRVIRLYGALPKKTCASVFLGNAPYFALRVIRLYGALPKKTEAQVIGRQVLRSGSAVGANYREGLRARSKSEYAAKLSIGLMELEETLYWFELLEHAGIIPTAKRAPLMGETSE